MPEQHAFTGLAGAYGRYRPDYPAALIQRLQEAVEHALPDRALGSRLLVDVGAGTGISTRLLRFAFPPEDRVVGVEPNGDMLRQAEASGDDISYLQATAEAIPLQDATAALVLAAQAVQWFNRPVFYAEAARVLGPGGVVAVLQNNRTWDRSAFLNEYEAFLEENSPGYSRFYRAFDVVAEIEASGHFSVLSEAIESWVRVVSLDEFIGMSLSSTKMNAVVRTRGREWAVKQVRDLAEKHHPEGTIHVPYRAELYWAARLAR